MAQKELRLRLVINNKILCYMQLLDGRAIYSKDGINFDRSLHLEHFGDGDIVFELGIKVGDKWIFEGDLIDYDYQQRKLRGTLIFSNADYTWKILVKCKTSYDDVKTLSQILSQNLKHIGTIHEKEKEIQC